MEPQIPAGTHARQDEATPGSRTQQLNEMLASAKLSDEQRLTLIAELKTVLHQSNSRFPFR